MTREEAKKAILDRAKLDKIDKYGQTIHLLSLHSILDQIYNHHEAEVASLKAQIEAMKCCGNCERVDEPNSYCETCDANNYSKWECRE